jgi:two-component sensor histidine kinase
MTTNLKFLLVFLVLTFSVFGKKPYTEIEKLILNDENQEVLKLLERVEANYYTKTLKRIALNKSGYLDYLEFVKSASVLRKFEYEQLNTFIQKRVKEPVISDKINMNYLKIKWFQVNNLRNEISLSRATTVNEKLKEYISKFKNQSDKDIQAAKIYANTHDIVMAGISGNLKLYQSKCEKDLKVAKQIKDTFLIMTTKYFYNDFYTYTNQVEPFIKNCKEILYLDAKTKHSSGYFYSTVDQLLDVYFYIGTYDQEEVENLLNKIHTSEQTRYYSYTFFAKYISTLDKNNAAIGRILKLFQQPDLLSFFNFIVKDSKGNMNNNQLVLLYKESSSALFEHGFYKESLDFMTESSILTRKIYSEELAESLADYKTKELKKNKELEVKQAKERVNFYITFSGVIAGLMILLIFVFINNRKKSIKLEEKNKENELLLKEIHHRVKNNFQTISSLIEMQGKNIEDEKTLVRLKEGQSRIKSMSLIHQKLYQKDMISTIDFQEYAVQLIDQILNLYGYPKTNVKIELNGLNLDVDTAIPIGLILNELVTNSCKYAFKENQEACLCLSFSQQKPGEFKLIYKDNGPGIPSSFDLKKSESLGLRLIQRLTKQLQGTFNYKFEGFSVFEIEFKDTITRKNAD